MNKDDCEDVLHILELAYSYAEKKDMRALAYISNVKVYIKNELAKAERSEMIMKALNGEK